MKIKASKKTVILKIRKGIYPKEAVDKAVKASEEKFDIEKKESKKYYVVALKSGEDADLELARKEFFNYLLYLSKNRLVNF